MLEEKLHVATWVHYGLAEVPGPALAYECAAHDGLHVHDAHFLPEIVDPASGERLPAGADGELVLTTLTARAMPLIRFRTGDRSRLLVAPCACGTPGVRIAWLEGRTDQLLVLRGVKLHRDQVQAHMAAALGFSPDRQRVFVNRQQGRQILEVWIGVDDRLFSDEIKMLEKRMLAVADHLHERLGVPVTVRLKERGSFQGPCTP
jgi:phenylacetate-CoA ligase